MKRPTPPDVEYRLPDCPLCDKELDTDGDSLRCYECGLTWSMDGSDGEWDDNEDLGCPSFIEWWNTPDLLPEHEIIRHEREQCILTNGHDDKHKSFTYLHVWDDGDPRIVKEVSA